MNDLIGILCHQLPERSPRCENEIFPLCFRCAGIYLGLFSSYSCLAVRSRGAPSPFPDVKTGFAIAAIMFPLWADGLANSFRLWATPAWLRAISGAGVGVGLPLLLVPLLPSVRGYASATRLQNGWAGWTLIAPLALSALLVALVVWPIETNTFHLLQILAALGMVCLCVNFALLVARYLGENCIRSRTWGRRLR